MAGLHLEPDATAGSAAVSTCEKRRQQSLPRARAAPLHGRVVLGGARCHLSRSLSRALAAAPPAMTSGTESSQAIEHSRSGAGNRRPRASQALTAALQVTASGPRRNPATERSDSCAACHWLPL
eukprot:7449306-Alexandrium_andersonii.AAC.1